MYEKTTLSLPTCTSILDLEFNFKDVSRKCEKLDHGIFHFENIFTFYDSKFYQSDNTWGVIIIELKEQKLWSYGLSTTTRTDLSRNNDALLREESNRLKESTSIASAFNLKTPEFEQLQSNQMSDFSLSPHMAENRYDFGIFSVLHVWGFLQLEKDFDLTKFVTSENMECIRQLVLLWVLTNDVNIHLYIDWNSNEVPTTR